MGRLWVVVGSLITIAALGMGTFQVVGLLSHEETTVTTTFDAGGVTSVRVDNENGAVTLTGADVDEITVIAHVSRGLLETEHREVVVDGQLVLDADCPPFPTWCDVAYTVTMPADLPVDASLDNGHLTAHDVRGAVTADGDNGAIDLFRLSGDVRVTNDNGRVTTIGLRSATVAADTDNGRVSLTFAAPPESVTATSDNGRVDIVVPDDDTAYRVDVASDHGDTDVGVRSDPASDRSITAHTDNGRVTVRYPTG